MECGPVIFPANEKAEIVQVREEPKGMDSDNTAGTVSDSAPDMDEDESRATDFDESLLANELSSAGYMLLSALDQTLIDIWWSVLSDEENPVTLVDEAIQKFHGAYVEWASEYVNYFSEGRSIPNAGEITAALFEHSQGDLDEMAKTTSLTINELRGLRENKLLPMESRSKLVELPETIQKAHQEARSKVVSTLCDELRAGGFSEAEKSRFKGLLGIENKEEFRSEDVSAAISEVSKLRESL